MRSQQFVEHGMTLYNRPPSFRGVSGNPSHCREIVRRSHLPHDSHRCTARRAKNGEARPLLSLRACLLFSTRGYADVTAMPGISPQAFRGLNKNGFKPFGPHAGDGTTVSIAGVYGLTRKYGADIANSNRASRRFSGMEQRDARFALDTGAGLPAVQCGDDALLAGARRPRDSRRAVDQRTRVSFNYVGRRSA
jgi:hypothetical protein